MGSEQFGTHVQQQLRQSGFSQKELAAELSLNHKVLSRKFHRTDNAYFTSREIRLIILILVRWRVITTRDEVFDLLDLAHLDRSFLSANDWQTSPLDELVAKRPLKVFFGCSHRESQFLDQLKVQLVPLVRQGLIIFWSDRELTPGALWETGISKHLNEADIILFLISPDFLASNYAYSKEVVEALKNHESGKSRIIPIILRPTQWEHTPFGRLQALPRGERPILSSLWQSLDEAFFDVVQGIRLTCEELQKKRDINGTFESLENPLEIHPLNKVFVKSGFPYVTFVEREDFGLLKLALAQPGRGVVIEGPSGVGKTTSLRKAIEEPASERKAKTDIVKIENSLTMLSARDSKHREQLKTLADWHYGTVVIDDFHRLDSSLGREIVDYLKHLADTEPESKKLVIVGIPQSGQTLVDLSFDIATRIDVFKWGKVSNKLILQMIEKGESALNIELDRKADIILTANGSLNVAQFLCLYICQKENIFQTENLQRLVLCDLNGAISNVMADLQRKFGESIRQFATMGGHRDVTCLRLLEHLSLSDDGFISLPLLKDNNRELTRGIDRFISERWMDKLSRDYPACVNHLFFDQATQALVIDDPQLTFYLSKIQFSMIAKAAGKIVALARRKVFISYSHKDIKWLERLRIHLTPLEREGILDLWDDTKILAGLQWKDELQTAIDSSMAAILLISADFLASDFIAEYELPKLLLHAKAGGTAILPLIVSPCMFIGSGVDIFQSVNSPDKPLVKMPLVEREKTLVKLAETVGKKLTLE